MAQSWKQKVELEIQALKMSIVPDAVQKFISDIFLIVQLILLFLYLWEIKIPHQRYDSRARYSQCSKYSRGTCHCLSPSPSEVSGIILDCTEWVWIRKNDSKTVLIRRSYHGKNQISKDIDELRMNWRDGSYWY